MSFVYESMLAKQKNQQVMLQQGKRQYEYDSDEDTEVILVEMILTRHVCNQ